MHWKAIFFPWVGRKEWGYISLCLGGFLSIVSLPTGRTSLFISSVFFAHFNNILTITFERLLARIFSNHATWWIEQVFFFFFLFLWSMKSTGLHWIQASLNQLIFQMLKMGYLKAASGKFLCCRSQARLWPPVWDTFLMGRPPKMRLSFRLKEVESGQASFLNCQLKQWHNFTCQMSICT